MKLHPPPRRPAVATLLAVALALVAVAMMVGAAARALSGPSPSGPVTLSFSTATSGLADGSAVELHPPAYAAARKTEHRGFPPLDGLQNARAEYRLRFTRPAADAYLEFRAGDGPAEA